MKKALALLIAVLFLAPAMSCSTKEEEEVVELDDPRDMFMPDHCPVSHIKVTPERVDDPETQIGSGHQIQLQATPIGRGGSPVGASLAWSLRYPDADDETVSGAGHQITAIGGNRATFTAGGLATGVFTVLVQDRSCNFYIDEKEQFAEGQAWITVYNRPGDAAACGRMRVTYGDRVDRMGDKLLASAKVTLFAEVSAAQRLGFDYKVKFFVNDKAYPGLRPLYYERKVPLAEGMAIGHISHLPINLTPGEWSVRYELVKGGQAVCASRTERFLAK